MTTVPSGPVGSAPGGFSSVARRLPSTLPPHLGLKETVVAVEEPGFTLVDLHPDRIAVRPFRWDVNSEPLEAVDGLEPFYATALGMPQGERAPGRNRVHGRRAGSYWRVTRVTLGGSGSAKCGWITYNSSPTAATVVACG